TSSRTTTSAETSELHYKYTEHFIIHSKILSLDNVTAAFISSPPLSSLPAESSTPDKTAKQYRLARKMAEPDKGASLTNKKKASLLDEDISKELLGSWNSLGMTGDDAMDFNFEPVPKGKMKDFDFGKLDMDFSLDGKFEKMAAFKVDMSDLDFSSPPKKSTVASEAKSGKETHQGMQGDFDFSFDFNGLDDFDFDSPLEKRGQRSDKVEKNVQDKVVVSSDNLTTKTSELNIASKSAAEIQVPHYDKLDLSGEDCRSKPEALFKSKTVQFSSERNNAVSAQATAQKPLEEKTSLEPMPRAKNQNNLVEESASRLSSAELELQSKAHVLEKTPTKQSTTETSSLVPSLCNLAEKRASMQSYAELKLCDPVKTAVEQPSAELMVQDQSQSCVAEKAASKISCTPRNIQDQSGSADEEKLASKQTQAPPEVNDQGHLSVEICSKSLHNQLKQLRQSSKTLSDNHATEAVISEQMNACSIDERSDYRSADMHIVHDKVVPLLTSDREDLQVKDSTSKHTIEPKNNKSNKNDHRSYGVQDKMGDSGHDAGVSDTGVATDNSDYDAGVSVVGVASDAKVSKAKGDSDNIDKHGFSVSRNMPHDTEPRAETQRASSALNRSPLSRSLKDESSILNEKKNSHSNQGDKTLEEKNSHVAAIRNLKMKTREGNMLSSLRSGRRMPDLLSSKITRNMAAGKVHAQSLLVAHDTKALRNLERFRIQGDRSTGLPQCTVKQASPNMSLKRGISQTPGASHLGLPPTKRLSPGQSGTSNDQAGKIVEAVDGQGDLTGRNEDVSDKLLSCPSDLPQLTYTIDVGTSSTDGDRVGEKAEAFGKELEYFGHEEKRESCEKELQCVSHEEKAAACEKELAEGRDTEVEFIRYSRVLLLVYPVMQIARSNLCLPFTPLRPREKKSTASCVQTVQSIVKMIVDLCSYHLVHQA
ncbi:hypothetical protein AKJ16_DCAP03218, partial [Drosera capensis]